MSFLGTLRDQRGAGEARLTRNDGPSRSGFREGQKSHAVSFFTSRLEELEPGFSPLDERLVGMDKGDKITKSLFKNFDQLASEGDFRDEKNDGFLLFEGIGGELEIDIGFTATGDTSEQMSAFWGLLEGFQGLFLGRIELNQWKFGCGSSVLPK